MPNFGAPGVVKNGYLTAETIDSRKSKIALRSQNFGVGTALSPDRAYNPPADARAWAVSPTGMGIHRAPQLLRGRISMWDAEDEVIEGASKRHARSVNFLYNPNSITHSYTFDSSAIPPPSKSPDDKASVLMSGQSAAWKLYFNRQYETAYFPNDEDKNVGTLADVQALERLLGISKPGEGVAAQLTIVVFGATPGGIPFGYVGWITSLNVNHLMFNHRMIPTVSEVDIQMARRMMPDATGGGSGSGKPGTILNGLVQAPAAKPTQTSHSSINERNQQAPRTATSPDKKDKPKLSPTSPPSVYPGSTGVG